MKYYFFVFFIFLLPDCKSQQKTVSNQRLPVQGYNLMWQDEFDGDVLDRSKWFFRSLGPRGDGFKSMDAVGLDGKGHLVIQAFKRGDSVLTGLIATEGLFQTQYGYFECRAQLPQTRGIFPAFWLQSSLNGNNSRPETGGAEIDIFEYFPNATKDSVNHTLHWGGYGATHKVAGPVRGALQNTKDGFHTFALEWTADYYTTYVDGVQTFTGTALISHVPEFMVLSVGASPAVGGPIDESGLPAKFIVDYVRVYKKQNENIN